MKWDGEWHITIEVFRDLGLAFAAVLVLIYVLMVGWFRSFLTPLVVMAAIPFSLVGILPAHGLLGAFFTATSMIGFMASAGIVVRNSIILAVPVLYFMAYGRTSQGPTPALRDQPIGINPRKLSSSVVPLRRAL
ncbi:MAG: efflux RND transporter permease subunit [Terrimicrobiaceae bacterium]